MKTWTPKYVLPTPPARTAGRADLAREDAIARAKALYERVCAELDALEVEARS